LSGRKYTLATSTLIARKLM